MKSFLLSSLAVVALAAGAPTAGGAHDGSQHYYGGGCSLAVVDDTTPNQALGGRDSWNGTVQVLARATTGGASGTPTDEWIEVRCELFVDGLSWGIVLDRSGSGVVAGVAKVQYYADPDDVVAICEHTVVAGHPGYPNRHTHCYDTTTTPVVPEPVHNAVNTVIDILNNEALYEINPTLCGTMLRRLDGQWGPIFINTQGDIFLFGYTDEDHLWYDCPPYTRGRGWPTPSANHMLP